MCVKAYCTKMRSMTQLTAMVCKLYEQVYHVKVDTGLILNHMGNLSLAVKPH